MHDSKKASFYKDSCRMMLGAPVNSGNTSSYDATITPIAGIETKPMYRAIYFNNGLGIVQKVK